MTANVKSTSLRVFVILSLLLQLVPAPSIAQQSTSTPPPCAVNFKGTGSLFKGFHYTTYADYSGMTADQVFVALGRAIAANGNTIIDASKDLGTISAALPVVGKANETIPLNALVTGQGSIVRAEVDLTIAPFLISNHNTVRDEFCKILSSIGPQGASATPVTDKPPTAGTSLRATTLTKTRAASIVNAVAKKNGYPPSCLPMVVRWMAVKGVWAFVGASCQNSSEVYDNAILHQQGGSWNFACSHGDDIMPADVAVRRCGMTHAQALSLGFLDRH